MNLKSIVVILIYFAVNFHLGTQSERRCGRRMIEKSKTTNSSVRNRFRRIVSGEHSYYGQWPWIVTLKNPILKEMIQKHTPKYMNWSLVGSDNHICGGTLVSPDWIVTAKHCLYYNFSPQSESILTNWSATMGAYDISGYSPHSISRSVDKVIYQDIGVDLDDNDFAMMHLSSPVNFTDYIYPACLPDNFIVKAGSICYAVGWGTEHSLNDTLVNPILKHATLKIMEMQESKACNSQTMKEICTSPDSGSVCRGDSGGPLLCHGPKREWVFVGVTVRGSGCQRPTDRSIFTSVYHHLEFVNKMINSSINNLQNSNLSLIISLLISVTCSVFLS